MSEPQQPAQQPDPAQPGQPYAQPGQPYSQPCQPYAQPGQPYSAPAQHHSQPGQPYSQPYAQPGQPHSQPGQPYSQPGQPYRAPAQSYAPGGAARPGALGRTAFLVAAVGVAIGLLFQLVTPFLYMSIGFGVVDVFSNLVNLLVLALAATGLVLGLIALRRPAPHLLAAIAIGLAGSTVVGTLVSWVSNLFYYFGF